jgi:hypothetical protein
VPSRAKTPLTKEQSKFSSKKQSKSLYIKSEFSSNIMFSFCNAQNSGVDIMFSVGQDQAIHIN